MTAKWTFMPLFIYKHSCEIARGKGREDKALCKSTKGIFILQYIASTTKKSPA